MKLSIIIVNFETRGLLKQLLKALFSFNLPFAWEAIIVDNNSKDGSKQYLEANGLNEKCKIIFLNKNLGFAKGVNQGLQIAEGEYYLLLNTDAPVFENAVRQLVVFMAQHPHAAAAGPRLQTPSGRLQNSAFRFYRFLTPVFRRTLLRKIPAAKKDLARFLRQKSRNREPEQVDWIQGSCMILRASAVKAVGPMDERYFMYFEDIDWCREFKEQGWQVWYLPGIKVIHYFKRLSAEFPGWRIIFTKAFWWHVSSWLKYFWKWGFKDNHA